MGKGKLEKFEDMRSYPHVVQAPFGSLKTEIFPLKGNWNQAFFKNNNPIVLELGCGKGEYAVSLAQKYPDKNFIGIDIKGARMWSGAKFALEQNLQNVGFLRTNIEIVDAFFDENEVDEIWITFPDPQMKKVRKRLTATNFIENYFKFLKLNGIIHLKTDSNFLFTYTKVMCQVNGFDITEINEDIYQIPNDSELQTIQTYYEKQWLGRGITIKYIRFLPHQSALKEPEIEIELDVYRSYNRTKRSEKEVAK